VTIRAKLYLSWDAALLVGAVLAPTDPPILIPLFIR
jgi:NhaP-type Na+/H+ or K+/H+ antiporter